MRQAFKFASIEDCLMVFKKQLSKFEPDNAYGIRTQQGTLPSIFAKYLVCTLIFKHLHFLQSTHLLQK